MLSKKFGMHSKIEISFFNNFLTSIFKIVMQVALKFSIFDSLFIITEQTSFKLRFILNEDTN